MRNGACDQHRRHDEHPHIRHDKASAIANRKATQSPEPSCQPERHEHDKDEVQAESNDGQQADDVQIAKQQRGGNAEHQCGKNELGDDAALSLDAPFL